uniref:C2H2-type domain-containing protein n=1 Tax=Trichuris muris TaxID=70415 RepID=A0A5S6QRF6_TRIMR
MQFKTRKDLILHIQQEHVDYSAPISQFPRADEDYMVNPNRVSKYFQTLPRRKPVGFPLLSKFGPERVSDSLTADETDTQSSQSNVSVATTTSKIEACVNSPSSSGSPASFTSANGKMPYVFCQVSGCGRRYKGERSLRQHIKVAHCNPKPKARKESTLHCYYCNKSYRTSSGLKSHMKSKNHQIAISGRGEDEFGSLNLSESGVDWRPISLPSFGSIRDLINTTASMDTVSLTSSGTVSPSVTVRESQLADEDRVTKRHQLHYSPVSRPAASPSNVRRLLTNRPQMSSPAPAYDASYASPIRAAMGSYSVGGYAERSTAQRCVPYRSTPIDHDLAQRPAYLQSSHHLSSLSRDSIPMEDKQLE